MIVGPGPADWNITPAGWVPGPASATTAFTGRHEGCGPAGVLVGLDRPPTMGGPVGDGRLEADAGIRWVKPVNGQPIPANDEGPGQR